MTLKNDGGPAFPGETATMVGNFPNPGMSLRDWFAGQAMAAFLHDGAYDYGAAAQHSYLIADAMLAARMSDEELAQAVSP